MRSARRFSTAWVWGLGFGVWGLGFLGAVELVGNNLNGVNNFCAENG